MVVTKTKTRVELTAKEAGVDPRKTRFADHDVQPKKTLRVSQIGMGVGGLMGDVQAMKDAPREKLYKTAYCVTDFYYQTGVFSTIAKSAPFNNITLGMIMLNGLWMGIDTDLNDADTLAGAELQFQIAEHVFAAFFSAELLVRFLAFEKKVNTLKDGWFKFDFILCSLMVFETWILPSLAQSGGFPVDTSMLRLLRLARVSRMMRLLRKFPELLTLLKGMAAAVRSVFSTLVLLVIFMYVFAIVFRQQTKGNEVLADYFGSMGLCFWTLLMQGTLLDDITDVLTAIKDDSPGLAALFLFFVLLGNFTILNMLIGVLCEVVSAVSDMEKEKQCVAYAKDSLLGVLKDMDADGSGCICVNEFETFLNHPIVKEPLEQLDVDRQGLLSLMDVIFDEHGESQPNESGSSTEEPNEPKSLCFGSVIEAILDLRNSNTATVKDVVELRKFVRGKFMDLSDKVDGLVKQQQSAPCTAQSSSSSSGEAFQSGTSLGTGDPLSMSSSSGVKAGKLTKPDGDVGPLFVAPDVRLKTLDEYEDAKQAVQQSVKASATVGEYLQDQSIRVDIQKSLAEKDALMQQVLGLLQKVLASGDLNNLSTDDEAVSGRQYRTSLLQQSKASGSAKPKSRTLKAAKPKSKGQGSTTLSTAVTTINSSMKIASLPARSSFVDNGQNSHVTFENQQQNSETPAG